MTGGDGADGAGDVDVVVEAVVAVAGVGVGGVKGAQAFAGDGAVCDIDKAGDIVSGILLAVAIGGVAKMRGGSVPRSEQLVERAQAVVMTLAAVSESL